MINLKFTPMFFAAFIVAGCGGGSDSDIPQYIPKTSFKTVAGPLIYSESQTYSPVRGCADGSNQQVIIGGIVGLGYSESENNVISMEKGECDGKYRIRSLDLNSSLIKTVLIQGDIPDINSNVLSTIYTPTSLAVLNGGDILVADSAEFSPFPVVPDTVRYKAGFGNGIWKYSKDGVLSKLVGFDTPNISGSTSHTDFVDGLGLISSFASITKMCSSKDGGAFVLDSNVVRHISASGLVETIYDANGSFYNGMKCSSGGDVLTSKSADNGGKVFLSLISGDEYKITQEQFNNIRSINGLGQAWVTQENKVSLLNLSTGLVVDNSLIESNLNSYSNYDQNKAPFPYSFIEINDGKVVYNGTLSLIELTY